jgi:hypothetical protein
MRLMAQAEPALDNSPLEPVPSWLYWRPNAAWALVMAALAIACLLLLDQPLPFIYFQF